MENESTPVERSACILLNEIMEKMNKLVEGEEGEDTMEELMNMPMGIYVRSDWEALGSSELSPAEYKLEMMTGVNIEGDLDAEGRPINAFLRYTDWYIAWRTLSLNADENKALLDFARLFF